MGALGDAITKNLMKAKGAKSSNAAPKVSPLEKSSEYRGRINEAGKNDPPKYKDQPVSATFPNDTPTEAIKSATSTPATGNPFFNQKVANQFGMGEQYEMYKPIIDKVADVISVEAVNRNLSPDNLKRNYIQRKQRIYQMG